MKCAEKTLFKISDTFPAFKNLFCFFFPQLRWGEFFPNNKSAKWLNQSLWPYAGPPGHSSSSSKVIQPHDPEEFGKKSPPEMVVSLLKIKAESKKGIWIINWKKYIFQLSTNSIHKYDIYNIYILIHRFIFYSVYYMIYAMSKYKFNSEFQIVLWGWRHLTWLR